MSLIRQIDTLDRVDNVSRDAPDGEIIVRRPGRLPVRLPISEIPALQQTDVHLRSGVVNAAGLLTATLTDDSTVDIDLSALLADADARAAAAAAQATADVNAGFLATFAARVRAVVEAVVPAWARRAQPPDTGGNVEAATEDRAGIVTLARNVDVADSETDLSRVPQVSRVISLVRRLIGEDVRSIPEAEASHVGRPLVATQSRRPWGAWSRLGTDGYDDNSITEPKLSAAVRTKLNATGGTAPTKATNALVDAVTTTGATLAGLLDAARAGWDDAAHMTVRKTTRLLNRVLKRATTTVLGVVLLARNVDVDASETDTSRALTVASGKRLIARVAPDEITLVQKIGLLNLYVDPGVVVRQAPATAAQAITRNDYRLVVVAPDVLAGEDIWVRVFGQGQPLNARTKMNVNPAPGWPLAFTITAVQAANIINNDIGGDDIALAVAFYTADSDASLIEERSVGLGVVRTPRVDDRQPLLPDLGNNQVWISRGGDPEPFTLPMHFERPVGASASVGNVPVGTYELVGYMTKQHVSRTRRYPFAIRLADIPAAQTSFNVATRNPNGADNDNQDVSLFLGYVAATRTLTYTPRPAVDSGGGRGVIGSLVARGFA